MKKTVVALVMLAATSTAFAGDGFFGGIERGRPGGDEWSGRRSVGAPEIDPASAMAGLTLLAGGIAVLRGRRKKN